MNYQETLNFLYDSLPMYQRVGPVAFKKDLSNIRLLCEFLGNPHEKFKSIHIAGTNGKGSSSHMIASVLQESGYKTGLYTSPHLKNFTERIRIDGNEIPQDDVVNFVHLIHDLLQEIEPSFFEITVAMAFWYFAKEEIDIAVIEVGLGGRLDSTNIIQPEVSLITNIGLDHMEMLGNTIQLIAAEKGGIIKHGVPVVIGEENKEYDFVFENIALKLESPVIKASSLFSCHAQGASDIKSNRFIELDISNWPHYQFKNIPGVLCVLELLKERNFNIPDNARKTGIENFKKITNLIGRWQILKYKPLTICDTGHNTDGIKEIVKEISKLKFRQLHVVWGMVKEKDIKSMLELLPADAVYYFCKPDIPRGQEAENILEVAKSLGLKGGVFGGVNDAYRMALSKAGEDDFIFIGGSTFVVAELEDI